jgi:hypothetical protein
MPFTPIIPASYQQDRQDLNEALEALLDAFIASTSFAIIRKFWSELPATLTGDGPFVALGDITEEIRHTEGLRITLYTGSIWYVDWLTDPVEYNQRVAVFADHMRDLFTANPTITGRGLLQQTGFQEGELRQGTMNFGAPQLLFTYNVLEGRN